MYIDTFSLHVFHKPHIITECLNTFGIRETHFHSGAFIVILQLFIPAAKNVIVVKRRKQNLLLDGGVL